MQLFDFHRILKHHKLTQSWAGSVLGRDPAVGRRWAMGSYHKIPKAVAIVLRLIDSGKVTPDDVARAAAEEEQNG